LSFKKIKEDLQKIDLTETIEEKNKKIRVNKVIDMTDSCLESRTFSNKTAYFHNKSFNLCKKYTGNAQGDVYELCDSSNQKVVAIIKKIRYYDNVNEKIDIIKSETLTEIVISGFVNILLENYISPNFVFVSKLYFCNSCIQNDQISFEHETIVSPEINLPTKSCIYMISEFVNGGTLGSLLSHYIQFPNILKNILFQILTSLSCLQRYFGIIHNDLHLGNILLQSNENTGYLEYKSDEFGQGTYYIPNNLLVKIIDFGKARIKDKIEPDTIINKINIYDNPIYGKPQHSADQRRLATLLLNYISGENVIIRTNAQNSHPGYYYNPATNTLFTNEDQFNEFCINYILTLKTKLPEQFDILDILQDMLIAEPLEKIIKNNFKDLMFYSPSYKITDSFYLNKPETKLTITNTKLIDMYSNPIILNSQRKSIDKKAETLPYYKNLPDIPAPKKFMTLKSNKPKENIFNTLSRKPTTISASQNSLTLKPNKLKRNAIMPQSIVNSSVFSPK
jgi:hypothetical protein